MDATCVFGFCVCPDGYQLTDDQEECVLIGGKMEDVNGRYEYTVLALSSAIHF